MMYRLLKDLLNWKVNLHIKRKLGRCRYTPAILVFCVTSLVLCIQPSFASENIKSTVASQNPSSIIRNNEFSRTLDHGIFRHDDRPFPPRNDVGSVSNGNGERDTNVVGSSVSSGSSSPDNRDRYNSYDRFKRSVTTLNFHPKPRNESKNVGLKPMRIFKYVTEEDVLMAPTHENRHNPHITIFHPLVNVVKKRNETVDNDQREDSDDDTNQQNKQRIVGGAKINLKAKLDKVISVNEANKNNNESDSEFKRKSSTPSSSSSPSKPENILIFKPSLAIRKNGNSRNNKSSLIPSGKYTKLSNNKNGDGNGVGDDDNDDQVGKPNIDADTTGAKTRQNSVHEESTDPNSSTVNDRSLIQPNLYFDSVVMLSEEGQKQLEKQQRKNTNGQNREKSTAAATDDEGSRAVDEEESNAQIMKNKIEVAPSSSMKKAKSDKNNKNDSKKKISPSLNATSTNTRNGNTTTSNLTKTVGVSEKKWNKKLNTTITSEGNKDKVVFKVVTKSSKTKNVKTYFNKSLSADDMDDDGSERSRRSPLKIPLTFQHPSNAFVHGPGRPLARAALFRTNNGVTRLRTIPVIKKKVMPRLIAPLPGKKSIRKNPMNRQILPMRPMPMVQKKSQFPNLALVPGPVGPGPVGPPIAAIKVTHLNLNNNMKGNAIKNGVANGMNKNVNTGPSASSNLVPNVLPSGSMNSMNLRPSGPSGSGKPDLFSDSSKTSFSFKPFPDEVLINHAASSYYSPTYKKFRKKFQNHITSIMDTERNIMDTQRDLEEGGLSRWEESRYPSSRHSSHKSRHRSSNRSHTRRPHRYDGNPHSHHRSGHGQHSHLPRHRPPTRGKKLSGAKYTYPKNAENIQDILKYFDEKGPPQSHRGSERSESSVDKSSYSKKHNNHHHPRHRHHHHSHHSASALPAEHEPTMPSHPKLADLSGEFRDVHASLLKDIREFAKRPHLFKPGSTAGSDHSDSKIHSLDSNEGGTMFDPIDEIFGPKPKPVRDLIKPDLYSLENIRERIALKRGKLGGRPKEKDFHSNGEEHRHSFGDDHRDSFHHSSYDGDDFYDSHRPSRHNSENDPRSGEHLKNSVFNSKEDYDSPSYSKRSRHKEGGDDSHTIFPSSHYHSSSRKDSQRDSYPVPNPNPYEYQSNEFPSTKAPFTHEPRKPIVLKRPNEPFRYKEAEPKKKPDHDFFWNSFQTGFEKPPAPPKVAYEPPLVIKSPTPSVLHPYNPYSHFGPASAASHALPKPVSVEDEDIVEIHTGHPHSHPMHAPAAVPSYPTPAPHHDPMKQEKLKKMYMDVLQQKMQIEAALMQPQASPIIQQQPVQFNHAPSIPSMHSSASLLPQHNTMSIPRLPHQLSYPVTPVTLSPLNSLVQRRKKPMRMKIHIYPNGHDGLEQGIEAANLLAAGGFGTSGFSASNPPGVVAPPPISKDVSANKVQESAMPSGPTGGPIPPTNPSGFGGGSSMSGPMAPVSAPSKNKNVVLHLHVHRRNDMLGPLELETEGSNPVPQTAAKPISFKEIFDEQLKSEEDDRERKSNLANHRMQDDGTTGPGSVGSHSAQDMTNERDVDTHDTDDHEDSRHRHNEGDGERDKSASMEAPIHDEKIEDVFHTIMKMRKKVDNRKKRS